LNSPKKGYFAFGAIDAKTTSNDRVVTLESEVVNGPSWDAQPIFTWNEQWNMCRPYGQPRIFDFEFTSMRPF